MSNDIKHYLDNPDDLTFDDPEAVAALADADFEAGDGDPDLKQSAPASAAEGGEASDTGLDEGTDDDAGTPAPIQAKDGKHFLPYEVLEGTRKQASEFKARWEEQQAANEKLRQQLEELQAGKGSDVEDPPQRTEQEQDQGDAITAEFVRKNGKTPDEFRAEYGDDLTNSFLKLAEDTVELKGVKEQVQTLMQDRNVRVEAEETTVQEQIQTAIDAIPALADIQANDRIRWKAAIAIDNELRQDPKYAGKSYSDRFAEVARQLGLPAGKPTPNKQQTSDDDLDEAFPVSLSDFPGGSPPSQSEFQTVEKADVADLGARFQSMSPKQLEAYLASL